MSASGSARTPMIFLAGPPGSGKTGLGSRICQDLGLKFVDLSAPAPSAGDPVVSREELEQVIHDRSADVVALSWSLQQDKTALGLARRFGELVLLWAHPLDMQSRSGHSEPLFTPVSRLTTKGGFGRHGTGCREFRRLDRACTDTLLLVDLSFDEAAEELGELVTAIRARVNFPPMEREGLDRWVRKWKEDHDADVEAAKVLVDAMARYTLHLKKKGTSPRTITGVYSDLDAAAMLVFMYDAPKAKSVLDHFSYPPWEFEFRRKFTDSPSLVARYRRSLEGFGRFLRQSGTIPDDEVE